MRTPRPPLPVAVVFDVDGTLVDSERDGHRVAFNQAMAAAGLPHQWDVDTYGRLLAVAGGRQRLERFLAEVGHDAAEAAALAREVHRDKTRRFVALVHDGAVPPRPGAHRLLAELQEAGIELGVATTGSRAWVAPLLARAFPDIRFASVLTADEVPRRKPAPDVYRQSLRHLDVEPSRTLVVEDAAKGLVAAHGAGLDCLVVVNDDTREEPFDGALLVVDGFGDTQPARVLAGPADVLDAGRVTPRTCGRVLARGQ